VELEHYHKANSNLELTIADLKLKLKAAEKEVASERARYKACAATVRRFKVDLNECVQYIQEPKLLKVFIIVTCINIASNVCCEDTFEKAVSEVL
jgi:hypothetical protein